MTDIFADATRAIFDTMKPIGGAHDAQLTRGAAAPVPVSVIISMDLSGWGDAVNVVNGSVGVSILREDFPERPRRGDLVALVSGRQFQVEQLIASDDYVHRCLSVEVTP